MTLVLLIGGPAAASGAAARSKPDISARTAVLVDARDGSVLYARRPRVRRPIASATKLMTALISLQQFPSLGRRLEASPYTAGPAESRINLRPGERIAVGDLLLALLLESANDAAVTLARGATGSVRSFVARMNERADRLDLRDTHYANPIGFDNAENYSSALDLSTLARALLRNPTFAAIVDLPSGRLRTGSRPRIVANRNRLVASVPWIDGVKTGHTRQAGYVLVGSGTRKGARLVSVVLGAPSEAQRDADTLALLRYGFGLYRVARPVRRGAPLAKAKVEYFGGREVSLIAPRSVKIALRRGQKARTRLAAPDELRGPLPRGTRVGSVSVFKDGKRVRLLPLLTAEAVPEAGFARKLTHSPLFWLALLVLLALAAFAVQRRAARRRQRRQARKSGGRPRRVIT